MRHLSKHSPCLMSRWFSRVMTLSVAIILQLLLANVFQAIGSSSEMSSVKMRTTNETHTVDVGLKELVLRCEFYADHFNAFDNPVVWIKQQLDQVTPIHLVKRIYMPFNATRRFEVKLVSDTTSSHCLILNITNLTYEDSGNYTCEVQDELLNVMTSITHSVHVRVPVSEVTMLPVKHPTTNMSSSTSHLPHSFSPVSSSVYSNLDDASSLSRNDVVFVDSIARRLSCVAIGGYPPPDLRMYLDDRHHEFTRRQVLVTRNDDSEVDDVSKRSQDVTDWFSLVTSVTLRGSPDVKGLQRIVTRSELQADNLVLSADKDRYIFRCIATIPGMAPISAQARVRVHYGPIITAELTSANLDERNVFLRCEVAARPVVHSIYWIIDSNGTTLTAGEVVNEYWSLLQEMPDGVLESKLFVKLTKEESFRSYTIVAENRVAKSSQVVQLIKKDIPTTLTPWSARQGHSQQSTSSAAVNRQERHRSHVESHDVSANHMTSRAIIYSSDTGIRVSVCCMLAVTMMCLRSRGLRCC